MNIPIVSLAPVRGALAPAKCAQCNRYHNPAKGCPGRKRISHCKRGHELAGKNLYLTPGGERRCQACRELHRSLRSDHGHKSKTRGIDSNAASQS
jgi:hypothetical protein